MHSTQYDYDPAAGAIDCWTPLRSAEHTARKGHKCDDCGGIIAPGQRYRVLIGVYDQTFTVIKQHALGCRCIAELDAEEAEQFERFYRDFDQFEQDEIELLRDNGMLDEPEDEEDAAANFLWGYL